MVDWLEQFLSLMPTQNELFKINTVPVSSYWLMLFEDFNIFYSSCWKLPPWPSVPQKTKKDCSKGKNYGTGTNLLSKLGTKFRTGSGSKYNVSLIPNSWIPVQQYTFFSYYQCCGAGPTLTGSGSRSRPTPAPRKKNLLHKFKEKNLVLKDKRR